MSELRQIVVERGVITFDGQVVETFGFGKAKGDSYGIQLAIDPSDDEVPALQELADAVRSASRGGA